MKRPMISSLTQASPAALWLPSARWSLGLTGTCNGNSLGALGMLGPLGRIISPQPIGICFPTQCSPSSSLSYELIFSPLARDLVGRSESCAHLHHPGAVGDSPKLPTMWTQMGPSLWRFGLGHFVTDCCEPIGSGKNMRLGIVARFDGHVRPSWEVLQCGETTAPRWRLRGARPL